MNRSLRNIARLSVSLAAAGFCLFASDGLLAPGSKSLLASAEAVIGRPLTPMSYAGVARRTTRRGMYGAAAVGAVGAVGAGAYYGSDCVQVADAYGRLVTQCK